MLPNFPEVENVKTQNWTNSQECIESNAQNIKYFTMSLCIRQHEVQKIMLAYSVS